MCLDAAQSRGDSSEEQKLADDAATSDNTMTSGNDFQAYRLRKLGTAAYRLINILCVGMGLSVRDFHQLCVCVCVCVCDYILVNVVLVEDAYVNNM